MLRRWACLALFAAKVAFCQTPGQPLAPWTSGVLDIHQIHTGRGNAALLVFPDGTTMLLDAGAAPAKGGLETGPQRPDESQSPAAWIAHYLRQASPHRPSTLDYAVITHYHDDHMGALRELAGLIPLGLLIDRGDDPPPPPFPVVREYLEFRRQLAGKATILKAGANQIVQLRAPAQYPRFEVRNLAANGRVWTGKDSAAVSRFPSHWRTLPKSRQPNENSFSIALRIRYGRFGYFTGGDLPGVPLDELPAWHDLETPVARSAGPVDAAVLNHHGWLDSSNLYFLRTLNPRVIVIPAWHATHPDHSVLRRLRSPSWPTPPDLFITSLLDAPRAIFRYLGESFRSTQGHILIRVAPGGDSYQVIILDDLQPALQVKSVHGPYRSRGN
ncbi:MAG: MBL fold metallo-hydrolase [Bryobacteraceae bacterium]|nr:MBL fold metallo-hydrolase [Bryobacteraceae bacterium]